MIRNLISVRVPASAIAALVTTEAWMDNHPNLPEPFPDDVRYVRAYHDPETDAVIIVLEHPSFRPTAEGCQILRVGVVVQSPARLIEAGSEVSHE